MPVTTGKVRLSYCHVWQPQVPQSGGEAKYSVTILIPKSDVNTLNAIYREMESTKQSGISSAWGGVLPPIVKMPLYDGDGVRTSGEPFGAECKGHMVITGSSKTQPYAVDINMQPILNPSEVYSGCYARVSINFFAYNQAGNKGIGCGLNGVQKIADGEPLAGGVSAQEAFGGGNAYADTSQAYEPVYQSPGMGVPQYQSPGMGVPQYQSPGMGVPQYQSPGMGVPQYQSPGMGVPQYQSPGMGVPQYQSPGMGVPQYQSPGMGVPQYQSPGVPQYGGVDPITGQPLVGGIMGM